jgi:hypothetical protein
MMSFCIGVKLGTCLDEEEVIHIAKSKKHALSPNLLPYSGYTELIR